MTGHRLSGGGIIRWFAACLALMALAFLPAGALAKGPPGHGGVPPGQAKKMRGHRGSDQEALPPGQAKKYGYRYWPEQRVFYSPERGLWFWLSAGKWRMGARLPSRLTVGDDYVSLTMGVDKPYRWDAEVAVRYGR